MIVGKSCFLTGVWRDKTMGDKFMYIPNDYRQDYPLIDNNLLLKRLNTQSNEPTNPNSIKVTNVMNKKTLLG